MARLIEPHYLSSLTIDVISSDADESISDTHKVFHLNEHINVPLNTHALIGLSSMNMVYSFYQFRSGINNSFDMTVGATTETITITEGNYTVPQMVSHLNTLFTSAKATLGLTVLTCSANYQLDKFYITCAPASEITFDNILCWKELGFETSSFLVSASATTHYMPNQYNLAGDASMYVQLKNQGLGSNINTKKKSGIIANIPIQVMYGELIFFQPASEIHYFRSAINLHKLEISLLDENMDEIGTLNTSNPWRMTFNVHFSRNKSINDEFLIKNEIKDDSQHIDKTIKKKKKKNKE